MNFPPPFRSLHSSLFIAFQYLPSPFNAFRRLSLPFIAFITFHRRPISLSAHSLLPRFVLASPNSLAMPPHSPASHTCFPPASSPPFVSHIRLSRTIVCAPLLYSFPLFCVLCFTPSPLCFIYSRCFAPVFLLPGNLRKPVAGTAKGNVFLIFQRNFAKSP